MCCDRKMLVIKQLFKVTNEWFLEITIGEAYGEDALGC